MNAAYALAFLGVLGLVVAPRFMDWQDRRRCEFANTTDTP